MPRRTRRHAVPEAFVDPTLAGAERRERFVTRVDVVVDGLHQRTEHALASMGDRARHPRHATGRQRVDRQGRSSRGRTIPPCRPRRRRRPRCGSGRARSSVACARCPRASIATRTRCRRRGTWRVRRPRRACGCGRPCGAVLPIGARHDPETFLGCSLSAVETDSSPDARLGGHDVGMGDYIEILGHPTWVETAGQQGDGAETVLLLHGGLSNSDALLDTIGGSLADDVSGGCVRSPRPRSHRRHGGAVPLRRHGERDGVRVGAGRRRSCPSGRLERRRHHRHARRPEPSRSGAPAGPDRRQLPLQRHVADGHPTGLTDHRNDAVVVCGAVARRRRPLW